MVQPRKEALPQNIVRFSERAMEEREVQPRKARLWVLAIPLGRVMEERELESSKDANLIAASPSGKAMEVGKGDGGEGGAAAVGRAEGLPSDRCEALGECDGKEREVQLELANHPISVTPGRTRM